MQPDLLQYLSPTPRLRCPASPWYRLTNLISFSMCELGIEKFWIWNWWLLSRYLSSRKADFKTCTGRRMVVVLVQASRTLFASGNKLVLSEHKAARPKGLSTAASASSWLSQAPTSMSRFWTHGTRCPTCGNTPFTGSTPTSRTPWPASSTSSSRLFGTAVDPLFILSCSFSFCRSPWIPILCLTSFRFARPGCLYPNRL